MEVFFSLVRVTKLNRLVAENGSGAHGPVQQLVLPIKREAEADL